MLTYLSNVVLPTSYHMQALDMIHDFVSLKNKINHYTGCICQVYKERLIKYQINAFHSSVSTKHDPIYL